MPSAALYQWSVAGSPVIVLLDLDLADKLAAAAAGNSEEEVGGILLGSFDDNYTVVTGFELIESEHRRGPIYSLSSQDERRLASRLNTIARDRKAASPVGYFRTHLRPGLFLDESDSRIAGDFFHNPNQVVLLVRPSDSGEPATGGFFFWEDGDMNRKQSYLPFPMNSRELETNDFPLVIPAPEARETPVTAGPSSTSAETLESSSLFDDQLPLSATQTAETMVHPRAPQTATARKRSNWAVIALIAAGAAFLGYILGTSHQTGGTDRRPGDIYLYPNPEPEKPGPAETKTAPPSTPAPSQSTSTASAPAPVDVAPSTPRVVAVNKPRPAPVSATPVTNPQPQPAAVQPERITPAPLETQPPPAEVAVAKPAPAPIRTELPREARAETTISLEAAEDRGFHHAVSKVPLFGYFERGKVRSGEDFIPAKALHHVTPSVPPGLARELTGTLPVDLKLTVDKNGRVSGVQVLSSKSDPEFIRLAGDAAYDFQFEPARLKDKPVSSDVIAHFRFRPAL